MLSSQPPRCLKLSPILGIQIRRPLNTLSSLFKLCTNPQQLKQIHARFVAYGLSQSPSISCELIERYADFGHLSLSERVYDSVVEKSSVLCNTMVRSLAKLGESERTVVVYKEMVSKGMYYPDEETCGSVLRFCFLLGDFEFGKRVHGLVVKLGLGSYDLVSSALAEIYRHGGNMVYGLEYWNGLISEAVQNGKGEESLELFRRMRLDGVEPNSVTMISLLRSSVDLNLLRLGKSVHSLVLVRNFDENLAVSTALLLMYVKLGDLEDANFLFEEMPKRDTVVWNIMISANSRNGRPKEAIEMLRRMGKLGVRADLFTALPVISSIAKLKATELCKQIHGYVLRNDIDYQVSLNNSLINMYCESGQLISASKIFNSVKKKDLISWSAMIKGYVKHDQPADAISLFSKMKSEGFKADFIIVINLLPACVNIGALENVKYLHGYSIKSGLVSLSSLSTALLVSYAKCGCIEMARKLFNEKKISHKDLIMWNSMIGAYAKHGDKRQCSELYDQMKQLNINPDRVTFLGILTACVNSGLVEEGKNIFKEMTESYNCRPNQEHYACLVDLLGRAGLVNEARQVVESMPFEPDSRVWGPLLSACKLTNSDIDLAEFAAKKLISMEPKSAANYVLLSNIYAASGNWHGVAEMRSALRDKGLKKTPGISWLEINGRVHEFRVADRSHLKYVDIYAVLGLLEVEFGITADKSSKDRCPTD